METFGLTEKAYVEMVRAGREKGLTEEILQVALIVFNRGDFHKGPNRIFLRNFGQNVKSTLGADLLMLQDFLSRDNPPAPGIGWFRRVSGNTELTGDAQSYLRQMGIDVTSAHCIARCFLTRGLDVDLKKFYVHLEPALLRTLAPALFTKQQDVHFGEICRGQIGWNSTDVAPTCYMDCWENGTKLFIGKHMLVKLDPALVGDLKTYETTPFDELPWDKILDFEGTPVGT